MNTSNIGTPALPENPEAFLAAFESNFKSGDVGRVVAAYAADALLNLGEGRQFKGHDQIRQAIEQFMSAGLPISLSNPLATTSGNTSVIFFDWKINGVASNGAGVDLHGRAMDVLKLGKDNQWRQLLDLPFGATTKSA
jgi:ketosteroid isomerase-like protein